MRVVVATSPEAGSGKTTTLVALGQLLRRAGQKVGYARIAGDGAAEDAAFATDALRLPQPAPVLTPTGDLPNGAAVPSADFVLVEADIDVPAGLASTFGVTPDDIWRLVVIRFQADGLTRPIVEHIAGSARECTFVVINAVPEKGLRQVSQRVVPELTEAGFVVAGVVPQDRILLGMSVADLAVALGAEVLCAADQLDRPVEAVMIAAMSDEGAETYFRRVPRKAVVAGGDRPDIHLPALATDTSCIVLTEGDDPDPTVLKTADEEGVPLLKVKPGTMETLENISAALRAVRFRQNSKVARAVALFSPRFAQSKLFDALGVPTQSVSR
jgi:BioD-like phosphotransacetylase family protein